MKVRVLKTFNDKQNKVIQSVGKVIEVTDERYEEIIAANSNDPFVEELDPNEELPSLDPAVDKIKQTITSALGKEKLEVLLKLETEGKNRKGVTEHIEQHLKEGE